MGSHQSSFPEVVPSQVSGCVATISIMASILSKSVVSVALVSVAVARASPAPSRSGDFDLTELMNKFLSEYESGHGGPVPGPGSFEQHQEEISYVPEPEPHHHHHHPQQYPHEAEAHMY